MRVLHVLSQRPSLTGSGITLDAVVRRAAAAGHDQQVVVGVPAEDGAPEIGDLEPERIHPVRFGVPPLEFPVPGMSDVMPYASSRFSELSEGQLEQYLAFWTNHLRRVVDRFQPEIIQSHHVWLVSSLLKDVAPSVPVVTQCHATGLRQMELCPHLADRVGSGCSRNDAFLVLHQGHAEAMRDRLGIEPGRIHRVGAGYREELFHSRGREQSMEPGLLYIGKYSDAKGLPWLLDAFERLADRHPDLRLHIAGGGAGPEAEAIRKRMGEMAPAVVQHGQLAQPELAELCRRATVCVLPSFYEGLPLVLVEAVASGCRLVATDLPGIVSELAPRLGDALTVVAAPRLETVDRPRPEDIPSFVDRLESALESALEAALDLPPLERPNLSHFTWDAVFNRVERIWRSLVP